MASIQEMKDNLAAEQTATKDVVGTAMTAIDTMLNLSMWVLGIFALTLALLALFGIGWMHRAVKRYAEQTANKKMRDYLESIEFRALIDKEVAKSVENRWQNTSVIRTLEQVVRSDTDEPPFKRADKKGSDQE